MECPHKECKTPHCDICRERKRFKSNRDIEDSKYLVAMFETISSPNYILHAGVDDPVLEAFEICEELKRLASEDATFKVTLICTIYTCSIPLLFSPRL